MRRQYIIIYILILILLFSSCKSIEHLTINIPSQAEKTQTAEELGNSPPPTQKSALKEDSLQTFLSPSLFPNLIESEENYEIYSDDQHHGFYYRILDNEGTLIVDGYSSWRFGKAEFINDDLLMVTENHGMALFSAQYFDVENGRISRRYSKPLGACSDLVAYFDGTDSNLVLVVRDLFDASKFYCEITDDSFTDSVFKVECAAEFNNDQTSVTITYPNSDGNILVRTYKLQ